MKSPLSQNSNGDWSYKIGNRSSSRKFKTKHDAAVAFVNDYITKNPKYKELVAGKKWEHIFKIFNI